MEHKRRRRKEKGEMKQRSVAINPTKIVWIGGRGERPLPPSANLNERDREREVREVKGKEERKGQKTKRKKRKRIREDQLRFSLVLLSSFYNYHCTNVFIYSFIYSCLITKI